jgi:hypothetical protein
MARRRRRWWAEDDDTYELVTGERDQAEVTVTVTAKPDDPGIEDLLAAGDVVGVKPIPWGSNYSFVVALAREGQPQALAVYKPRRGEIPLWDFPDGTLYLREYAAYRVSRALGLSFIPPTVIREGPQGVGTFQLYVEPDDASEYYGFRNGHVDELRRIALFDIITNNADRKAGHCFKGRDGRIWGIDHGLCFNVVPKLRTVIWDFVGQELPNELHGAFCETYTDPVRSQALRTELTELLHPDEVEAFFVRLERVCERAEFPVLDPYRNVPRGFF